MIDDTVLPKPFATAIEHLAWICVGQEHKPVYGFSLVLLVWTNGYSAFRSVFASGTRSPLKYALALELLSYARHRRRCRPDYVLFDAWYPSKALLKRIRDYGCMSSAVSRRTAASMASPFGPIGVIPIGRRPVG